MTKRVSHKKLLAIALFSITMCSCRPMSVVNVVDLSGGRLPRKAGITVDGRRNEEAWNHAVVMPFEKTGKAAFAWNNRAIYGHLRKHDHEKFGLQIDEQVCVSVSVPGKVVRLSFAQDRVFGALILRQALVEARGPSGVSGRTILPSDKIEVSGVADPAKRGFGWSLEFSVPWRCLGLSSLRGQAIMVRVYRLLPSRSRHVLRMKLAEEVAVGGNDG